MPARFILIIFLAFLIIGFSTSVYKQLTKQATFSNPVFVLANIINVQEKVRYKKGRKFTTLKHTYKYNAEGKDYTGHYEFPESKSNEYNTEGEIDIVYAKEAPSKSVLTNKMPERMTIWSYIKLFLKALLFSFFATVVVTVIFEKVKVIFFKQPE